MAEALTVSCNAYSCSWVFTARAPITAPNGAAALIACRRHAAMEAILHSAQWVKDPYVCSPFHMARVSAAIASGGDASAGTLAAGFCQ